MPAKGSHKPEKAKFIGIERVHELLAAPLEAGAMRDHYLLACTYFLCRRIGEVVLLQPKHFVHMDDDEVLVPLLKRKTTHRCTGRCKIPCPRQGVREMPRGMAEDDLTGLPLKAIPLFDGKSIFKGMLEWAAGRDWLFQGQTPKTHLSVRRAQDIFRLWADVIGLDEKVTPHSLRHTACSLVVAKAGVVAGRDLAAHSSVAITDIYTHLTPEDRAKAKGALSGNG